MKESIEIYIRHSRAGTFLNIHLLDGQKVLLEKALQQGHLEGGHIAVELAVQPEWIKDDEVRRKVATLNETIQLRIPISTLNVSVSD